jgi:hypothetical protein
MKQFVWLSFDLGVKGDYQGMYAWLDSHEAKECGDGVACFFYEYSGDLLEAITRDLRSIVLLDEKRSRVYLIRLLSGKMKGTFIVGRRRSAPWVGTAASSLQEEDSGG